MAITRLRTNHHTNPIGRALDPPSVSWITQSATGKTQSAAQIIVAKCLSSPDSATPLFDSGRSPDISSLGFELPITLEPYSRYHWRVIVWTDAGETLTSEWAFFETAKLGSPWEASWIRAALPRDDHPYLRREFALPAAAEWGRAYVCGLGLYELEINGEKVSDEYLMPGYHSYDSFVEYQTYDIGPHLRAGQNCVGALLGKGWYKGKFCMWSNTYGDTMQLIAELRIRLVGGEEVVIVTNEDWTGRKSPVALSGIYDGEDWVAAEEASGWSSPGFDAAGWSRSVATGRGTADLTERVNPPLTIHERLKPQRLLRSPKGQTILDFGQEITGWVEFACSAPAGTTVRLSHCEILANGEFYNRNLGCRAEFVYVADGSTKTARPHFTYFGFRYVRVAGLPSPDADDFTACALYSAIERTGWIETSDARLNQLVSNTLWSQKDNFLDIPTDCPQRCERIGWCGDVTAFCDTASQHMYTPAFFDHYLKCLRGEQVAMGGQVPIFAPAPKDAGGVPWHAAMQGSSVWGDVASILPWSLWTMFGDVRMLRRHWPLIRDWAHWVTANLGSEDLWVDGRHFGDWLALDTGLPKFPQGATDEQFIASAFYFHTLTIAAKAAAVLGLADDRRAFEAQAARTRAAFLAAFYEPGGELKTLETQTALVVALRFGLFPDGAAPALVAALVRRIEDRGNHLDTGFVGTFMLPRVLSRFGANATAYTLLLQDTFPSWLYAVKMGATTIWERWNGVLESGVVNPIGMNSLNHYAFGAIAGWMYRVMCGLNPREDAPGYRKALVKPMPDPRVKSVRMVRETAAGRYEIDWEYQEGNWHCRVVVPFNCEALVALPGREELWVAAGEYVWDCPI